MCLGDFRQRRLTVVKWSSRIAGYFIVSTAHLGKRYEDASKTIERWRGKAAVARALGEALSWPEAKRMMVLVARTWDEMADPFVHHLEDQKKTPVSKTFIENGPKNMG
jgi:hypothetical protein